MKARLANLLLIVATIALMLGAFEIACRTVLDTGLAYHIEMWKYAVRMKRVAADPEIGHEHVPGARARLMGADVTINSLGLRDRERTVAKPPGTKRILMLGDSITFGWGVDQDKTMSAVLQDRLNAAGAAAPVEVINAGVGNYNTAMEVAYFLAHGLALGPDIVVLNYFINDAEPTQVYRDVPWLARHAYMYPVAGGAWGLLGGLDWDAYYAGLYAEGAPGWRRAQAEIASLAEVCAARGIRLIVAHVPELHVLSPYPFAAEHARVAELAAAKGIEYLDLLPVLQGEDPRSLWVTVPDPHPNAKAQRLMAEALAAYLLPP